ncbi:MAG: hypothetical protein LBE06_03090 [Azoarcus sp.]|nr:hypothetical protein [Azoarcus sp.]
MASRMVCERKTAWLRSSELSALRNDAICKPVAPRKPKVRIKTETSTSIRLDPVCRAKGWGQENEKGRGGEMARMVFIVGTAVMLHKQA